MIKGEPLVSVVVITYNSSEYVIETLDSVLAQTYQNIELIISDDCSTDNTVTLCQKWIDDHKDSKIPLILVKAEKNTGVAGNCNRGLRASHGEWLKFIAGDDMLAPTAIESYVGYVSTYPEVKHLIACAVHFVGTIKESDLQNVDKISQYMFRDEVTAKDQYKVITKTFFGSGPTYFIHAATLKSLGGFDERFQMQEDYPLFIKMIGKGYKMMYLDHVTVYKRIVPTSIQYDRKSYEILPKNRVRMVKDWKFQYKMEVLNPIWQIALRYSLWVQMKIIKNGNSYKSIKSRIYYYIFSMTDPFVWYGRRFSSLEKRYLNNNNKS